MSGSHVGTRTSARMQKRTPAAPSRLRSGDAVRVRSEAEILATLDATGRLDGLPFMPEMLRYCGSTARVYKRADKTCDTITPGSHRRLHDTVHLDGLRCDGEAHGGCQALCLLFWKEDWLERIDAPEAVSRNDAQAPVHATAATGPLEGFSHDDLVAATRADDPATDEAPIYRCQATELVRASTPLPWWEPRQYVRDVRSGNYGLVEVALGIARFLFVGVHIRLTGSSIPFFHGRLGSTPRGELGLQEGERVRVRTRKEIEATVDRKNRNRGLSFDSEMVRYCGRETRVLRRVEQIVDERTGRMRIIPGDCLILDGAICTAEYHLACPRSIYPYWRETWVTRVDDTPRGPGADAAPIRLAVGARSAAEPPAREDS
jgi:hypothetical protein